MLPCVQSQQDNHNNNNNNNNNNDSSNNWWWQPKSNSNRNNKFLFFSVVSWPLFHISTTVFLFTMGYAITIPTHPIILARIFFRGDVSMGSTVFGLFMSLYSLLQFFSNATMGKMSDLIQSRKRLIMLQALSSCTVFVIMSGLAHYRYHHDNTSHQTLNGETKMSTTLTTTTTAATTTIATIATATTTLDHRGVYLILWVFYLISRFMNGLWGNIKTIAMTHAGDISTESGGANADKAVYFGMIGMSISMAWIIGPIITGFISGPDKPLYYPCVAALMFEVTGLVYAALFVHDASHIKKGNLATTTTTTNHFMIGHFIKKAINEASPQRTFQLLFFKDQELTLLSVVLFLYGLGNTGFFSIWMGYARILGYSAFQGGLFITGTSIGYGICQGLLMRPLVNYFGEHGTALLSLFIAGISNICLASVSSPWLVFVAVPLASVASMTVPLVSTLASKKIELIQQGTIQGALSSLNTLSAVLSPLVLSTLFRKYSVDESTGLMRGAPFYFCSLSMFLAFLVLLAKRWIHSPQPIFAKHPLHIV